ncbi:MAG TPA: dihydrofolate reductase family protein [Nocardioidaceae bacterium]|nr:dihydrofolate reductase family protein [Nocardioidaceae bacterium]
MERPCVITFNLVSVDGRLTLAPGTNLMAGDERWSAVIEGIGDPYLWVREAHDPDLLLEGSGSFLADENAEILPSYAGAEQLDRAPEGEHHLPQDVVGVPGRRWFAVVDGRGRVDLRFTEWPDPNWAGWHALVLTSRAAPAAHLVLLRERGIPYLVVGKDHVALPEALRLLGEHLGVRRVVCTGGGRLSGALLRQDLVDEVDVEILPVAIGGRGTPALFDAAPLAEDEWPTRLELVSDEALGDGRVRLRYRVVRSG